MIVTGSHVAIFSWPFVDIGLLKAGNMMCSDVGDEALKEISVSLHFVSFLFLDHI